jgi:hypothetical protein
MTNSNWWIGSNAQAQINLLEISVMTLLKHLKSTREQLEGFTEFGQIENLAQVFIDGADLIRNAGRQEPKYRADMLRIFGLIETHLETLKTKSGIDLRTCQNTGCDICRY